MRELATFRQSILSSFETCPRRTRADMAIPDNLSTGNVGVSADLGTLVHEVNAEILRTLRRQGEAQIPTQEAVEIMREVYAASPIVLPAQERDDLRWLTLGFCNYRFEPKRFLAIEQKLEASLRCPDGETRTVTGTPDLLMQDSGNGIIILDWKSGRGKPPSPRKPPPEGQPIQGKQYLSERGHMQLDTYGFLAMTEYPAAEYAILRELHLRSGEIREATLGRDELEHVEHELAAHMQKLDTAIEEGEDSELWRPRPGRHCLRQCPVARSCPIPVEQRGEGSLENDEQADQMAREWPVVDGLRDHLRENLKAYHEDTGYAPQVGDGTVLRWKEKEGGGRSFGQWPAETNGNGKAAT